ncbi:MAG: hypothetical protein ACLTSG_12085 [Lachnospiraceae bacterium]
MNAPTQAGLRFWGAEPLGRDATPPGCAIRPRDLEAARAIALRCQCSLEPLRYRGAPAVRRRLRHRLALMRQGWRSALRRWPPRGFLPGK